MHQRNIFKLRPPNHEELAKKYPQLRSKCFVGVGGKICIDFSDAETVRLFTEVLLHEYFELNVSIPKQVLVPRLPQRLNYLLLIEDLIALNNLDGEIVGVDIGTGALCIFSLLGAALNGWKFVSTDISNDSIQNAKNTLKENSLDSLVTLINSTPESFFKKFATVGDFSLQNLPNKRKNQPRSGTSALAEEISCKGGEVNFICQMIEESQQYPYKTRLYTTMIGKHSSLRKLKSFLEEKKILNYKIYILTQGRTFRWVLVWSFFDNFNLNLNFDKI